MWLTRPLRTAFTDVPSGAPAAARLLLDTARQAWAWNLAAAVASVVSAVSGLLVPAVVGTAVDRAVAASHEELWSCLMLLGLLVVAGGAATATASWARSRARAESLRRLRHAMIDSVLQSGLPALRRLSVGDVGARLSGPAQDVADASYELIGSAIAVAAVLYVLVSLTLIHWALALVLFAVLAVSVPVQTHVGSRLTPVLISYQQHQSAVVEALDDALVGVRTIRSSGRTSEETDRILASLPEQRAAGLAMWRIGGRVGRRSALFIGAAQIAVLATAAIAGAQGILTAGQVVAAVAYVRVGIPFAAQTTDLAAVTALLVSAGRVREVLDLPVPSPVHASRDVEVRAGLEMRGVRVTENGRTVLDGVDAQLAPGSTAAIVGVSAHETSVLARVAAGLLVPDQGTVTLDGTPVRPGDVSVAFEHPQLVGETLGQALGYGQAQTENGLTDLDDLNMAVEAARVRHIIERLPQGFDTPLDELALSGGEMQRLGIARALFHGRRLTVFDHATSSLDAVSESAVLRATAQGTEDSMRLLATRRPDAAEVDVVIWLDGGRVRAVGRHDTLLAEPDYCAVFMTAPTLAAGCGKTAS
ncbi:ABC transporter ATP-binding protein [Streptomyces sp. MI02-7b]|uniref:ABC transporter ATP-binding protein n=1 Tax=Streptomyces sp. MI02-7b TaxID=462941 RepID=UPI0029BD6198|nr:ABC transporter ATP-binding protein [Streptomyces sp. MI02-7b]MDX3078079.1 ABC transporter ATP-binding protein [Streptomyces sp. MI02-7b]